MSKLTKRPNCLVRMDRRTDPNCRKKFFLTNLDLKMCCVQDVWDHRQGHVSECHSVHTWHWPSTKGKVVITWSISLPSQKSCINLVHYIITQPEILHQSRTRYHYPARNLASILHTISQDLGTISHAILHNNNEQRRNDYCIDLKKNNAFQPA